MPSVDTVCDVLIAGSGIAGFTAGLRAESLGMKVIMVEKEPLFGGTSAYSAGMPWIPANPSAVANGDSAAKAMTYLHSEIGPRVDRARIEAYLAHCNAAVAFLEACTSVRFAAQPVWSDYHPHLPGAAAEFRGLLPSTFDGRRLGSHFVELRPPLRSMMIFGGMMVGREDLPHLFNMRRSARSAAYCLRLFTRYLVDRLRFPRGTRLANGNGLVAAVATAAFARGIPLWLSSPAIRLLVEDGAVVGAVVNRKGVDMEVRTRRGVILACGGFPWNEELKSAHYPHVRAGKKHVSAAPRSNTGDGIRLAQSVGARFDDNADHAAAWSPVSLVPQADGTAVPFPHFIDRAKPGVIVVDRRGKRFANEAVSYHDFVPKMIEACRNDDDVEAFVIADHSTFRKYGLGAAPAAPAPIGSFLRSRYLMRGGRSPHSPEPGCDCSRLRSRRSTRSREMVRSEYGGQRQYQRFNGDRRHQPNPCVGPIERGPFYAVKIVPGDLGTFMGLKTDSAGRVLGRDGPIDGLYAVGNDAASVCAGHYPGPGSTIGPAITFAYLAAGALAASAL